MGTSYFSVTAKGPKPPRALGTVARRSTQEHAGARRNPSLYSTHAEELQIERTTKLFTSSYYHQIESYRSRALQEAIEVEHLKQIPLEK